jgi:hypothetical protein
MCLFDTGFICNTLGTLCKAALTALAALADTLFVFGDTLGDTLGETFVLVRDTLFVFNTIGCCAFRVKAFV